MAMSTTLRRNPHPDARGARPDEWFESYTPLGTPGALRARLSDQQRVRRQIIDDWLEGLPREVRPVQLAAHCPEVVMRLIASWDNRSATAMLLDEYLARDRLGQPWLGPIIPGELARLGRFVRQVRPTALQRRPA
jgi:hypothetical protein